MTAQQAPKFGQRHVQLVLLFTVIVISFFARGNTSIALVAMTNAAGTNLDFVQYDWSLKERSYILSSFYWGYTLTNFFGGWIGHRFGVRRTIFGSTCCSSLLTLLPPFCVSWGGWQIFFIIRFLTGFFQGCLFPCINAHIAMWCPPKERNLFGALVYSALDCGLLIIMFGSGIIATTPLGWPGIFYVSAGTGFIWCAAWYIYAADTPHESRFISTAELNYIANAKLAHNETMTKKIPVPWRAIFKSVPFWTNFIVVCAVDWCMATMQIEIPTYLSSCLSMNMENNAIYSALPFFMSWLTGYLSLFIAEILLRRELCSLTVLRKTYNTIATWLPALCFVGIGFLNENQVTLALVLLTLNVALRAPCIIGAILNIMDLSTHHAGILMGLVNTGGNTMSVLTPLVTSIIVTDEHNRDQWQIVFYLAAFLSFVGNLIYIIFGRMEAEPWDAEDFLTKHDKKNERKALDKVELEQL